MAEVETARRSRDATIPGDTAAGGQQKPFETFGQSKRADRGGYQGSNRRDNRQKGGANSANIKTGSSEPNPNGPKGATVSKSSFSVAKEQELLNSAAVQTSLRLNKELGTKPLPKVAMSELTRKWLRQVRGLIDSTRLSDDEAVELIISCAHDESAINEKVFQLLTDPQLQWGVVGAKPTKSSPPPVAAVSRDRRGDKPQGGNGDRDASRRANQTKGRNQRDQRYRATPAPAASAATAEPEGKPVAPESPSASAIEVGAVPISAAPDAATASVATAHVAATSAPASPSSFVQSGARESASRSPPKVEKEPVSSARNVPRQTTGKLTYASIIASKRDAAAVEASHAAGDSESNQKAEKEEAGQGSPQCEQIEARPTSSTLASHEGGEQPVVTQHFKLSEVEGSESFEERHASRGTGSSVAQTASAPLLDETLSPPEAVGESVSEDMSVGGSASKRIERVLSSSEEITSSHSPSLSFSASPLTDYENVAAVILPKHLTENPHSGIAVDSSHLVGFQFGRSRDSSVGVTAAAVPGSPVQFGHPRVENSRARGAVSASRQAAAPECTMYVNETSPVAPAPVAVESTYVNASTSPIHLAEVAKSHASRATASAFLGGGSLDNTYLPPQQQSVRAEKIESHQAAPCVSQAATSTVSPPGMEVAEHQIAPTHMAQQPTQAESKQQQLHQQQVYHQQLSAMGQLQQSFPTYAPFANPMGPFGYYQNSPVATQQYLAYAGGQHHQGVPPVTASSSSQIQGTQQQQQQQQQPSHQPSASHYSHHHHQQQQQQQQNQYHSSQASGYVGNLYGYEEYAQAHHAYAPTNGYAPAASQQLGYDNAGRSVTHSATTTAAANSNANLYHPSSGQQSNKAWNDALKMEDMRILAGHYYANSTSNPGYGVVDSGLMYPGMTSAGIMGASGVRGNTTAGAAAQNGVQQQRAVNPNGVNGIVKKLSTSDERLAEQGQKINNVATSGSNQGMRGYPGNGALYVGDAATGYSQYAGYNWVPWQ